MKVKFIPLYMMRQHGLKQQYLILLRGTDKPKLIMSNVVVDAISLGHPSTPKITGTPINGFTMADIQDGDTILFPYRESDLSAFESTIFPHEDVVLPFDGEPTLLNIAHGLEKNQNVFICTPKSNELVDNAVRIYKQTQKLYHKYPAYSRIMMNVNGEPEAFSLARLASVQTNEVQEKLVHMFLTLQGISLNTIINNDTLLTSANNILERMEFTESFQLLTQEDQVGAFIDFSKLSSGSKAEHVPDSLIESIKTSDEYNHILELLANNGLGVSPTQQFNVFQQVGYLSSYHASNNIMYNLSDMGAGKTLMTVESICLLDLKLMSTWKYEVENDDIGIMEGLEVNNIILPDKHIIAPTLSIKSSWIDTFRLFYDVEEIDVTTYKLSLTYNGLTAISTIYVAPFTIKNALLFVSQTLPEPTDKAYLIIDEIHQLVNKKVPKTKFFPPKTNPADVYNIFVLSGTMSNLKTQQWFNYLRFMGLDVSASTTQDAKRKITKAYLETADTIRDAVSNIRSIHHRRFDCDNASNENFYDIKGDEKHTSIEEEFYATYGTQIIKSDSFLLDEDRSTTIEAVLESRNFGVCVNPTEVDTTNFQLFYKLIGSQAVTAQSTQIAEELFGEQKQQHVSDIIKTVSPLSESDIRILKTLHHIAEDHAQYKSPSIAKAINTAILNLNDGLQTKNIYEILSRFADKNLRFFEYLTTLDINILEQLPASKLINSPKLEDTDKFKILTDILSREKDETHLIVVNDFYALKALSTALGVEHITKQQLSHELDYQEVLDDLFTKQSIVVVTQDMIKSSLDLVQANRLIQYQLNTEISDIIQTQNRINRIGQTRETRGYYIASDALQENLIELFLTSYRNIRVAHKGIVELFVDITSQINIVNDYLAKAFHNLENSNDGSVTDVAEVEETIEEVEETIEEVEETIEEVEETIEEVEETITADITNINPNHEGVVQTDGIATAVLYPQNDTVLVLIPMSNGSAFTLGTLSNDKIREMNINGPIQSKINLQTYTLVA